MVLGSDLIEATANLTYEGNKTEEGTMKRGVWLVIYNGKRYGHWCVGKESGLLSPNVILIRKAEGQK
jgi:hypothetical protein